MDVYTIVEKTAPQSASPTSGYEGLRHAETKIRLHGQILDGYRNGLKQREIVQLAIDVYQEAFEDEEEGRS